MTVLAPDDTTHNAAEQIRQAIVDGERIIQQARVDYGFNDGGDKDHGPMMRRWLDGRALSRPAPSTGQELIAIVETIMRYDRAGRSIAVSLGLARLRARHEASCSELPVELQSWDDFVANHIPLPATRVNELIGRIVHSGEMRCTSCGVKTFSRCGCAAPYIGAHRWAMQLKEPAPTTPREKASPAFDHALAAVTAHPEKSNRALAAEIGVAEPTVRRARRQLEASANDDAPDDAPDRRIGRDGHSYPAHKVPTAEQLAVNSFAFVEPHPDVGNAVQEQYEWKAANMLGDVIAFEASLRRDIGVWETLDHGTLPTMIDQAMATLQAVRRKMKQETAHGKDA